MGVTVVFGRAGSGKSRFLMARIKELIQDPFAKVIVIVPGPLTFETEKDIMQQCGVAGILGLEVMSIARLSLRILEETGCPPFLTHAERAMICRRALDLNSGVYSGCDRLPDFEVCVAALVSRLKSHSQTPESLRLAAAGLKDTALRTKLRDTADILEKYNEICGSRMDASDIYAFAAQRCGQAAFLPGAHVIIDGLDSTAPAVMSLLSKVVAMAADTYAAFRGDGNDDALFETERRDMQRFIEAAGAAGQKVTVRPVAGLESRHQSEALKFLEANLYRYPYEPYCGDADSIGLTEAETVEQEVERLAAGILAEVAGGCRFRDIAVVGGGIDAYLPAIKSVFSLSSIPVFIDERRSLADNTFFDFLFQALSAAAGDMTAVEGYVFSDYAPVSGEMRLALKSYTGKYALKGWHFMSEFWRGDAAAIEPVRRAVIQPLKALTQGIAAGHARAQIAAVRQFLDTCGAQDKLAALCASIDIPEMRGECAYFRQVYEKSIEVLDGIGRVFGDSKLEPAVLCGLVKTGFESTRIAVIPPTTDEVAVFDISVARLPGIKVLFAIGVHDGVWPARDDGPGILSASERELLLSEGLDVGVYDLSAEKLKIYTALSKPKNRLVLSWNRQTGPPSVLIDRLWRLFPELKTNTSVSVTSLKGMQAQVLGDMADVLRGKMPDDRLPGLCARFLQQPGWRDYASAMLLRTNAAVSLNSHDAAALYGGIRCSATRIENYYKCPFKHFLDNGLRVQVPRDYTQDRIDIGTYMHLALDLFARALISEGVDIGTISEAETIQRMKAAAVEAAQQHDNGKLTADERFAVQYALLTKELVDTALRIRAHFSGSQASIYLSEQSFGFEVPTASGNVVITGKIDRVDTADGYFRVVDYKSSATRFALDDVAAGTLLQLPVYISAAQRVLTDTGLKPAGGYYMKIGDSYGEDSGEVEQQARMHGISLEDADVLRAFSALRAGGGFVAVDQALTGKGLLNGRGKTKYFSAAELDALLEYALDKIKKAAEDIYAGADAICPIDGACQYCDYMSICLMNAEYTGNMQRIPETFDRNCLNGEAER